MIENVMWQENREKKKKNEEYQLSVIIGVQIL